jgi:hypothetical protein
MERRRECATVAHPGQQNRRSIRAAYRFAGGLTIVTAANGVFAAASFVFKRGAGVLRRSVIDQGWPVWQRGQEGKMGKSGPNRVGLFRVAVIVVSGGLLAACAAEPIEPVAASAAGSVERVAVSAVDPIEPTSAPAASPIEPTAVSAAGSVDLAPVSATNHRVSTDIVGPVDLGPEPATIKTAEIAGPIQDARGAVHTAPARRRSLASNQSHRSVTASHRTSPSKVAARQVTARKQAKVSAETRAVGPKT